MNHKINGSVLVVVLLLAAVATGRAIEERAISGASAGAFNSVGRYCDSRSICGWEIYGDLRRHIYYLRNQCECPPATRCVRVEDDVLQEAYIYRCRRIVSSLYV